MSYEFKPYPFTAKRYEAELPALADGVETKRHAVAIVGGGPVGLHSPSASPTTACLRS